MNSTLSSEIRLLECDPGCQIAESAFQNCARFQVNEFGARNEEEVLLAIKLMKLKVVEFKQKMKSLEKIMK